MSSTPGHAAESDVKRRNMVDRIEMNVWLFMFVVVAAKRPGYCPSL